MNARTLADSIHALIDDGASPEQAVAALVSFARRMNLEPLLPRVITHLEERARLEREEGQLQLVAPTELSDEVITLIRSYIGAPEDAVARVETDPELVSGFVAVYNNVQYDASGRTHLKQLRSRLMHNVTT